jgi:hypothetical protein
MKRALCFERLFFRDIIFLDVLASLFFILSVVLYLCTIFLKAQSRHTHPNGYFR